jgi:hypothetical protein
LVPMRQRIAGRGTGKPLQVAVDGVSDTKGRRALHGPLNQAMRAAHDRMGAAAPVIVLALVQQARELVDPGRLDVLPVLVLALRK